MKKRKFQQFYASVVVGYIMYVYGRRKRTTADESKIKDVDKQNMEQNKQKTGISKINKNKWQRQTKGEKARRIYTQLTLKRPCIYEEWSLEYFYIYTLLKRKIVPSIQPCFYLFFNFHHSNCFKTVQCKRRACMVQDVKEKKVKTKLIE